MKLWEKGYKLNKEAEKFTVGEDYLLDGRLLQAEVWGSIAHAKMLTSIKILSQEEFRKLKKTLLEVLRLHSKGKFTIHPEDEDVHTAVENYLIKKLGNLGKKIHTGRSRNDQVIVDLRLYTKEKLLEIEEQLLRFCQALLKFSRKNEKVAMPGYTHSRKAMPSTVGLWASAFLESLLDDLTLIKSAYGINDQCPLGSAASYGVPLQIDRQLTSDLLGFEKVQNNVLYVNNSRGKVEATVLFSVSQVMLDLGKMAGDIITFSREEFGYFHLPEELCPGSSIMPQKKNPAILEILRAKSKVMQSYLFQVLGIINDLPSGYNRDLQLTKEPLIKGLEMVEESLRVGHIVIDELKVDKVRLKKSLTKELFAADEAFKLVEKGMPFRDAYREIAKNLNGLKPADSLKSILSRKHLGAPGNLGLDKIGKRIEKELEEVREKKGKFERKKKTLTRKV